MRNPPAGWPRISTALNYEHPAQAIDWLERVFGFEVRLKVEGEGGRIEHSELQLGGGVVMVGDAKGRPFFKSPQQLGGANTQTLFVYVDDVDAHCERSRAAGAKLISEPKTTDYGEDYWVDRGYGVEDLEGHHWYFAQRVSGGSAQGR